MTAARRPLPVVIVYRPHKRMVDCPAVAYDEDGMVLGWAHTKNEYDFRRQLGSGTIYSPDPLYKDAYDRRYGKGNWRVEEVIGDWREHRIMKGWGIT